MRANNFELSSYLRRINFTEQPSQDIESISKMMQKQLFNITFENYDVQCGKIVSLEPEHIVEKILNHQRGGYCYELNGLFAMALTALGINYKFVAARPMFYPMRRPKTHMVVLFDLKGTRYLADLGFGSFGIRAPIALTEVNKVIKQGYDEFQLCPSEEENGFIVKAKVKNEWVSQFAFSDIEQEWIDFMPVNYLNSTHPETIFVKSLLLIRYTENGRIILLDDKLKTYDKGQVTEEQICELSKDKVIRNKLLLDFKPF
ncbi:arylamine N-acetyltransferase [Catenovulum sp. SM1970]|uniref:arylamine N-acetyltransferase family protein n=1 Tax=Marinifaba aquimaris TaxID=2741323 RepID=UPI001574735D|nr:arylamine N-acetyltransferase [Marinifaba aquimaris]NTS78547.1 arylamine N-acetyltransferase [Marinifaba aquimaris]